MRLTDSLKQQEIMQAVVIADDFNKKFSPLTDTSPLVLLPVVDGVLLEYILLSLEDSGIQETFIFCCAHSLMIRNYVNSSRWCSGNSGMSVTVISSLDVLSMGDVMRELDAKAIIRSDFVLINGPVITTYPLNTILEEHRKLRQTDRNCALTLVYRTVLPSHRIRCKEQNFVVAVEASSKKIRYYQRMNKLKLLRIPLVVFQENDVVTVHYDLLDSCVSICSPCVPPLFSDNFDYQTMDDFVKGLLVSEELLGNSMYIHVVPKGYGACMSNFYMYDVMSQDVIARWTYPYVPDLFETHNHKFSHSRYNIYKEPNVEIGRNCKILQNVVIAKGTRIGENAMITNSVIGPNCTIGENVTIRGSYIWSGSTIGDGCSLDNCLLAERVELHKNVIINPGCVLGEEVVIDDGINLAACTKLQSHVPVDENVSFGFDDFDEQEKQPELETCDESLVGKNGHGYLVPSKIIEEDSDDEDDETPAEDVWGRVDEIVDDDDDSDSSSSHILSPEEELSEESDNEEEFDDEAAQFYKEVLESLQRGLEEKVKSENMILEINSSKHAYNVTMKEVNTFVIRALLKMPLEDQKQDLTAQQYLTAIKPSLQFFKPLISNYIRSPESEMDCLSSMQDFMASHESLSPAVMKVVHFWYGQDLLSESVIMEWYKNIPEENEKIRNQASAFIKWLQEADEESSDDE